MNIVMIGPRSAGKSSYAVGLHSGLVNEAFAGMKLVDTLDPVGYLNAGQELLAQCRPVARTNVEVPDSVALIVSASGAEHKISIPDRSGEVLRFSQDLREWDTDLAGDLGQADGVLIFVNPMAENFKIGAPVGEAGQQLPGEDDDEGEVPRPWNESMTPSDVRIVDALQELAQLISRAVMPVGFIVSAFDELLDVHATPGGWLRSRLPLVVDFLETNADQFPSACFGVSVQGRAFAEGVGPDDDEPDPWDRAWALDADGEHVELCEPLAWLLRQGAEISRVA